MLIVDVLTNFFGQLIIMNNFAFKMARRYFPGRLVGGWMGGGWVGWWLD